MYLKIYSLKRFFSLILIFFVTLITLLSNISIVFADDLEEITEDIIEDSLFVKSVFSNSDSSNLDINSRSCIVIDRLSHTTLYGKKENEKVKMASTTKIMTAIIVIENSPLDKTVYISKKAASIGGSRLGLKENDKISILDLLYGLLLSSGNDASIALAESVSGNVSTFLELMNSKAKELNLVNTHFESPHGLDSDNHYTTAYELALLSDYALQNKTFRNIVCTKKYSITINGYYKSLLNTNELLGNMEGIYGIKTGFTNGANRCLVTACKRGELDLICVVLGADTKKLRTKDSIKLLEYCFKNYKYYDIKSLATSYLDNWQKNNPNYFTLQKGTSNKLELLLDTSIEQKSKVPIKKELIPELEIKTNIISDLKAPMYKNDILGKLTLLSKNEILFEFNIISNTEIKRKKITDYILEFFKRISYVYKV